MKKNAKNTNKGVTIIALSITIIVLLILAGVSIATLTGENGILTQADEATRKTNNAAAREKVQIEVLGSYGTGGKIDKEKLNVNLKNIQEIDDNTIPTDTTYTFPLRVKLDSKDELIITEDGDITIFNNPETLTIGEAINGDKYGCVVEGYDVTAYAPPTVEEEEAAQAEEEAQTEEESVQNSNVWRLFYQDINYTYIISDELVGSYIPSNYYSSYTDGSKVSTIGQKLNSAVSSLFTETEMNTNANIMFTAWITDPEVWKANTNKDAVFAIGSPTVELFVASYNNSKPEKDNEIVIEAKRYGYKQNTNTSSGWLSSTDNGGIYSKDSFFWWLASPSNAGVEYALRVNDNQGNIRC